MHRQNWHPSYRLHSITIYLHCFEILARFILFLVVSYAFYTFVTYQS
ncbi:hypothetical protein COLSTE_01243 [Collinsella stercoris DSM 13279]|uniref:Uncharacterized protein n=1 Tax=Collinsella stercoris DSM 13279 TaxID=445975 RepID=B6GAZ2_9ACTN|nr:hypothetical protein COLSTE_01243 [Collinsella stercoris DSM 13279]